MNPSPLALLTALAVVATTLPASAQQAPETLTRTGTWVADYNVIGCSLIAEFGTGEDKVIARFLRDQPGDAIDFSLYGARFGTVRSFTKAKVDFGLGSPSEHTALAGHADKLPSLLLRSTRLDGWKRLGFTDLPPNVTPEEEAKVTGVTVSVAGHRPLRLEFGSLTKPFGQLRHCTAALVESWGYDPAEQAAAKRPVVPKTSPPTWIRDSDYPMESMRRSVSGIVRFRVGVAASGDIENCQVLAQTEPSNFGAHTCRLLRTRARFDPALDASGKPMRSYFVGSVSWLTP